MFERTKHEWRRKRAIKIYDTHIKEARAKHDRDEVESLLSQQTSELSDFEDEMNKWESSQLMRKARVYDIDIPPWDDQTLWEESWIGKFLSAKGRTHLRTLIDAERNRRFEVKVRWLKLLTPIIAAVAGLIGTITGLVAVLKK